MMRPMVAAAIVTYKKRDAVMALIERLVTINIPIFVTVNASDYGTVEAISSRFPEVSLLDSATNLGGTGGFNCAILAALSTGAKYIVLLDDDVLPAPDCIDRLAQFLEGHADYVFAAPAIYLSSQPDVLQETGGTVDLTRRLPVTAWNRFATNPELPDVLEIGYASACCLMVRSDAVRCIGVMDWNYFIFSDDVDWSLRLREVFGKGACVTAARAWHDFPWAKPFSPMRLYFFQRNGLYLISRMRRNIRGVVSLLDALIRLYRYRFYSKWIGDDEVHRTLTDAASDAVAGAFGRWRRPIAFGARRRRLSEADFKRNRIQRVLLDISIEDVDAAAIAAIRRCDENCRIDILCDAHRVDHYREKGVFSAVYGRRPGRLGLLITFLKIGACRYDMVVTDACMEPRRITSLAGRSAAFYHDGRLLEADSGPFRSCPAYLLAPFVGICHAVTVLHRFLSIPPAGKPSRDAEPLLNAIGIDPQVGQPWSRAWFLPFSVPSPHAFPEGRPFFRKTVQRLGGKALELIPENVRTAWMKRWHAFMRRSRPQYHLPPLVSCRNPGEGELSGGYREWCRERDAVAPIRYPRVDHRGPAPIFSILAPVCDPAPEWLKDCIDSVRAQSFSGWELILSDDGSGKPWVRPMLAGADRCDRRIRVRFHDTRTGISGCTNRGAEWATGKYLLFLDHDDILDPHALSAFMQAILRDAPAPDILYADEDRFDGEWNRIHPGFKPAYSPEKLLSTNYIHHPVVIRRTLFNELGGLRSLYDGSQDHDLLLRAEEVTRRIVHVPDVLYHMRLHAGSLAAGPQAKPDAHRRDRLLIEETLKRRGIDGEVCPTRDGFPGHHTVWRRLSSKTVSVLLAADSQWPSDDAVSGWEGCQCLRIGKGENWISDINTAAAQAKGELLIIASGAICPDSTWKRGILPHLERPEIGLVSGKIVYHDNRLHHCGLVLGTAGAAGRWHHRCNAADPGYGGWMSVPHEVSAVSWRFMGVQRARFLDMGGFDDGFASHGVDIDLSLRLTHEKGLRHLVVPDVSARLPEGFHEEDLEEWSLSDLAHLWRRWGAVIRRGDPYLNPNFSLMNEDIHLVNKIENEMRAAGCFAAYDFATISQLHRRFIRGTKGVF
ncbi:MAG: glycosyltransferase [Pseudomonadota bacterium]